MLARIAGFACGLAVAAGVVISGMTPASHARLGAQLEIETLSTGELAASPDGIFLEADGLEPGGPDAGAHGVSRITNQTATPLDLRARVLPSSRNLDRLLRVRITAAGKRIFDDRLALLREWTQRSFRLRAAHEAEIQVRAWLPASVEPGYEASGTRLTLIWKTRPVEG